VNQSPNALDLENSFQPPDFSHPFGTDNLGRDNFLRILHGSGYTLLISISASLIAIFLGLMIGTVSGISGSKTSWFIMRITDIFIAFPKYFIFILALGVSDFSTGNIILILSVFSWMETAKIINNEIKQIKTTLFYQSALCQGISLWKIFYYHLLPNLFGIIISGFTLLTATMIILESGISFIGLGVQAPKISLGIILNQARYSPIENFPLIMFTGLFIVTNVAAFNLLGDGLKKVFDQEKYQK